MIDIGTVITGILIGAALAVLMIYLYIRGLVKHVMAELEQQVKEDMIGIIAEIENDMIYCYTETDHTFVAQGTDAGIIRDAIRKRFPNKIAYLAGGDVEAVTRLQAELKELKEAE